MTRRLALAWCWGSVCGLVVGWVYGSHVQRLTEAHRLGRAAQMGATPEERARARAVPPLRRPEPREGLPAGTSATEVGNGARKVAQPMKRWAEAFPFDRIPAQRDDEPCTHTLGTLTCPFRGPHDNHTYQGMYAPDAKSDADEEVE